MLRSERRFTHKNPLDTSRDTRESRKSETKCAPPPPLAPPLCVLLRHYVAMLIAAVLQGRQAGEQAGRAAAESRERRLTNAGCLTLGKSHTQHLPIL